MEHPKYLVTGGAGFIGSHLVDALLARGEPVVVLDDLSTGRLENLARARGQDNFQFVQGSVLDASLVDDLVRDCDCVVHLAAAVGVKLIVEQPLNSFTINTKGTETVIGSAHRYDRRVILASTSEIYGKNSSGPLSETSDRILGSPSIPRWSYSTAKAVDEILAELYRREYGLRSTIVRFFNTVGPRQSPAYGMVIPRFARQAVRGEPLTVYGTGQQSRCFLHVADVVEALLSLIDLPDSVGETFNIGSDEETSILDLAERIIARAKSTSSVRRLSYSEAYGPEFEDMERRVPDTTKLRAFTRWQPQRNLDDVLADAVEDARSEVKRQVLGLVADGQSRGDTGNSTGQAVLAGPCPV
ncbi:MULTISPECIES: NAD-dependent epimerase/dehydratase family protein [unclassified Streptomyces]|uniref:NAD-dependent epimerase/dehydratase family protein n=1 Tax=unclassified Streptomyces TaxID=2593676 RepID=UPI002DD88EC7|nr:NAD-dependent epimerase/dehydratase family protein [Streptomyces sp. NBC_01750]WSB01488.1 GDP-mannose 4,6-dehydratase [Streptomyces sp. NBC_01794]WSD34183.1 GDP-mannose 4,6-dehydratase [Streptomyces sp. NBC_01750]